MIFFRPLRSGTENGSFRWDICSFGSNRFKEKSNSYFGYSYSRIRSIERNLSALSTRQNRPAWSLISQTECTNLNDSLYATSSKLLKKEKKLAHTTLRMYQLEEFDEPVLQISTLPLRSDRSG